MMIVYENFKPIGLRLIILTGKTFDNLLRD